MPDDDAEQAFYESFESGASGPPGGVLLGAATAMLLLAIPLAINAALDEWSLHIDDGETGPENPVPGYWAMGLIGLLAAACVANIVFARSRRKAAHLAATSAPGHHRKPATFNVVMAVLASPALLLMIVYLGALIIDLVA